MSKLTREEFRVLRTRAEHDLAQSREVPSILICAGTGCIAGGSMKIYENLKQECAQRGLPTGCAHARVPQSGYGIARRGAGKAPVVAQPLAVRRLGRDGARHARERFCCAPDAPGVRAAPAGHGQGAGVAPALCAQGGSVGFGHEDPSRNGLQYRNFSHPAGNLCGDKKKYLTPARPWRILLVL